MHLTRPLQHPHRTSPSNRGVSRPRCAGPDAVELRWDEGAGDGDGYARGAGGSLQPEFRRDACKPDYSDRDREGCGSEEGRGGLVRFNADSMIASWGWCGGDALPSVGSALPQQLLYRETFSRSTLLLLALHAMRSIRLPAKEAAKTTPARHEVIDTVRRLGDDEALGALLHPYK